MSPPPVRVETNARRAPSGEYRRARFLGGVRHQQMRFAAFRGRDPDIAAGDESDLGTRGTERGFGEIRDACGESARGNGQEEDCDTHIGWLYRISSGKALQLP